MAKKTVSVEFVPTSGEVVTREVPFKQGMTAADAARIAGYDPAKLDLSETQLGAGSRVRAKATAADATIKPGARVRASERPAGS